MRQRRSTTVLALGLAQTLAWASSYYLPAMLALPMARALGLAAPDIFAAFSVALVVSALVGPRAGRMIDQQGGRRVLAGTSLLFATGLALMALSTGFASLLLAWGVMGIAMGSGLYEAAFSTLVRLHRLESRRMITGITLIAGFASTVGWPLSAWLATQWGWREACWTWAALHVLVGLPLNLSLPRAEPEPEQDANAASPGSSGEPAAGADPGLGPVLALSFVFATTWFTSTAMAAHFPRLLQGFGIGVAGAVAIAALIGPAQVAARVFEFGLLRRMHPLLSARLATLAHPLGGLGLLILGAPAGTAFGLLHGAGNGVLTIAKGTLPLVIFGAQGYGHRQGLLMFPARMIQAFAPWLFGLALDRWQGQALWLTTALGLLAFGTLMLLGRLQATQP
ncbi:MFS transporter [Mitsuaria sp. WAJ17]|uniref:MFS transporter n=1 Tax=Mitsuaria sp. WAJ17 TaxID=2761452 RepID=UPI0016031400|nr:MFS transporter [Mitsuaria sp. WAJ17]MBB2487727.1 MFS transporter [Mitsuaria sp. WAJ17]